MPEKYEYKFDIFSLFLCDVEPVCSWRKIIVTEFSVKEIDIFIQIEVVKVLRNADFNINFLRIIVAGRRKLKIDIYTKYFLPYW